MELLLPLPWCLLRRLRERNRERDLRHYIRSCQITISNQIRSGPRATRRSSERTSPAPQNLKQRLPSQAPPTAPHGSTARQVCPAFNDNVHAVNTAGNHRPIWHGYNDRSDGGVLVMVDDTSATHPNPFPSQPIPLPTAPSVCTPTLPALAQLGGSLLETRTLMYARYGWAERVQVPSWCRISRVLPYMYVNMYT